VAKPKINSKFKKNVFSQCWPLVIYNYYTTKNTILFRIIIIIFYLESDCDVKYVYTIVIFNRKLTIGNILNKYKIYFKIAFPVCYKLLEEKIEKK